uniref:Mesoderm posterior protein 2 n=1 Tax=Chinchilla lanigera TaxID=34839 RepID=A0A8C2VME7_CHILA
MARSPPPPHGLLGLDPWVFSPGWGWAGHADSTSPASSSSDSSGSCPCDGARGSLQGGVSWGSPSACPGPSAAAESLGSRVSDADPWGTPPYCPKMQSPPHQPLGIAPDAALWMQPQACAGTQPSPEPASAAVPWTPTPPPPPELVAVYQGISVQESCLSLGSPPLLAHPSCQRLQPHTPWGCWGRSAEVLPSSEPQGPRPAVQPTDVSPAQRSGLRLSGCPELCQEDLEGTHLGIFY